MPQICSLLFTYSNTHVTVIYGMFPTTVKITMAK